ncbi:MarR family winged helix-turn-helix transcriptional regulator [Williamsia sp. MIQD14]|uniref:MarR family winged helix-turn-helix transcriptional regulator n=1 Tax=Williamsia sp. MIQD14 TaxID=3425703 RepID=UPI003DA16FFC
MTPDGIASGGVVSGGVVSANEAWEALYRAQATIARELADSAVWDEVHASEYGVLHALSAAHAAPGKRITDLADDVLLTQPGLSRLIARMETRGLITRSRDGGDGRAVVVTLTEAGRELSRRAGSAHAREVSRAMRSRLSPQQMAQLRDLCSLMIDPHA